jgi:uncharacterized membrane protein YebE (DUF533 family)
MLNNKAINITEVNVRKIEGAIKNGQCRETGNIGYTRYKTKTNKTKKQKKPQKTPQDNMCWTPLYANKHK